MSNKSNTKKYRKLDDIEHVLLRPSRYIGSVKPSKTSRFLIGEDNKMIYKEDFDYIAGLLKLYDEIITNSVDESKREGSKLNTIKVNVRKDGLISVWDNGGIPVEKHEEYDEYIPELIFSNLKAGANFNDNEERTGAGTHGEGSTLVNIFSKSFKVTTCDGKNVFTQLFTDNMGVKGKPTIKKGTKNFTEIEFMIDYNRFGLEMMDDIHYQIFKKRTYDIAGTNPHLKVYFNDELFTIKSFKDYIGSFVTDYIYEEQPKIKLGLAKSNGSMQQISFVNSTETSSGGKHVDYVLDQIVSEVRKDFLKKYKYDLKPQEIKNHLFLFLDTTIINPAFDSQTKEKLATEPKDFGFTYKPSDKFIKAIMKSEIVASITDWLDKKKLAELNKQERELNKKLEKIKVAKLIDAQASQKDRLKCSLGIFEGLSASTAFDLHRDKEFQGCYSLKGKLLNVINSTREKILKGTDPSVKEVVDLMSCIGLKIGQKAQKENLRYGKIIIYTDADCDGSHIAGLILAFFYHFWKELFDMGVIYKAETPIIVAKKYDSKGKIVDSLNFYNNEEYNKWQQSNNSLKYEISYKKGLSSLEDDEYREIIQNPRLTQFIIDDEDSVRESVYTWFGKESNNMADKKEILLNL